MSMNKNGHITGNFYPGEGTIKVPENPIIAAAEKQRLEKANKEANDLLLEAKKAKQKEIEENAEFLNLEPQGNKIVILPYPENPYKQIMQGNIIVDQGNLFKNPDSGEWDKMEQGIMCGQVIEIGPACKQAKVGADVFYESRTVIPVPFMGLGYVLTSEGNAHLFINDIRKDYGKQDGE